MRAISEQDVQGVDLGGRWWKVLVAPDEGGCQNMTFGVAIFPPGSDPGLHRHDEEEEIFYVISGNGESQVGDQLVSLKPGVAVYTEPCVPHGVKNIGDEPLVLVSVFSPPR